MGFDLKINFVLRNDKKYDLKVGETYEFEKSGSRIFCDSMPIWLAKSDWKAVAEIRIVKQIRNGSSVAGTFQVLHVYTAAEQQTMTKVLLRMFSFSGEFDPFCYLLEDRAVLQAASETGFFVRDDLAHEGFIHSSPADQLTRVANKYYLNVDDLVCACVRKEKVLAPIKYESAAGAVYPHIYGPLNMDAVDRVISVPKEPNGQYNIDEGKLTAT